MSSERRLLFRSLVPPRITAMVYGVGVSSTRGERSVNNGVNWGL